MVYKQLLKQRSGICNKVTFVDCIVTLLLFVFMNVAWIFQTNDLRTIDATASAKEYEKIKDDARKRYHETIVPANILEVHYNDDRILSPSMPCYEGEIVYMRENPDIAEAFEKQEIRSGYFHWSSVKATEGRRYSCNREPSADI